ncbi:aminoglycoside phosphotransferase family protein [uncultured Sphingomonas sp.]|uniref:phosphotransferase enzyme family protein n=1 Tax=uncultured Sphingomonas sp. TaxID=158754 RepID=UPI0025E2D256|nr:aminoglycoside phosphotransferase family protein [uncultured Sphingomonas sp.]
MADDPHLAHGMGTDLEPPQWPAITPAEAEQLLARFPAAGRLERLTWHSPRPFSAATLADTTAGTLFLKRHHHRLRTPRQLTDEHAFLKHLGQHGQPVVELLATATGATALQLGNWTWEVHRKAPGLDLYRDRQSWTPFLSPAHARAAGAALARLHKSAGGFAAPARPPQPLVTSLSLLTATDPIAAAAQYAEQRPALATYLASKPWRAALDEIFAQHRLAEWAPDLAAQPAMWTHNDWHPSNLLWTDAGAIASILDFGLSDRTCALHDLATALERSAVRWLELGPGRPSDIAECDDARALLEGYAAVRPLRPADRALLARLLPLVHVEFALSEVDYFAGVAARPALADLAWHDYLIGHADWFLSEPGRGLLAAVAAEGRY